MHQVETQFWNNANVLYLLQFTISACVSDVSTACFRRPQVTKKLVIAGLKIKLQIVQVIKSGLFLLLPLLLPTMVSHYCHLQVFSVQSQTKQTIKHFLSFTPSAPSKILLNVFSTRPIFCNCVIRKWPF